MTTFKEILERLKSPIVLGWIASGITYVLTLIFKVQLEPGVITDILDDVITVIFALMSVIAALNNPADKKNF